MSDTKRESGNPQTTADALAGDGSAADLAMLLAAREETPEIETGRETDLSQEPETADEAGIRETDEPASAPDESAATDLEDQADRPETAADDVETPDEDEAPEPTVGELKRINKLTAKLKDAEEREADLQRELDELRQQREERPEQTNSEATPSPTSDPVERHPQVQELAAQMDAQRGLMQAVTAELRRMEDEGEETGSLKLRDGSEYRLDRPMAEQLVEDARRQLNRLDARDAVLRDQVALAHRQQLRQFSAAASKAYDWMADQQSEERAAMREVLQQYPFLKSVASHELDLADLIAGRKARLAREAEAQKAPPKPAAEAPRTKVKPPGGRNAPVVSPATRQDRMRDRLTRINHGSAEELAAALPEDI